ncbi:arginine--tRNA ligase [Chondrinema litorale]|uniref:arginine--tRNA ligase n=1 Tax=Chondrinema litorale TaxID=2994555 RepID=UPI0025442D7C|nr:arginine--tRNA ligase [Chondrinema litorale]UZR94034.1 arginine--tRNA ligase [Chondrinema litorale]
MNIEEKIGQAITACIQELYGENVDPEKISLQATRRDFEGNYTFVTFPYSKVARKKPEAIGEEIGNLLLQKESLVEKFNVVKGFLNLSISQRYWIDLLIDIYTNPTYGKLERNGEKVMVEYSSPNTNKPLHLGHLRNNFLGYSVSQIMDAGGYEVMKTNLVNDRGIHICKSMLAYQKFGNGETPTAEKKGDKLVGDYYVKFDKAFKEELAQIKPELKEKYPEKTDEEIGKLTEQSSTLLNEAKAMLKKWEEGDTEVVALWEKLNNWVYEGFDVTYKQMGVSFDKVYKESETYLLGKDIIEEGLAKGVFYKKPDGSVWIDLSNDGLDEKLVLRADGTSVYMTQDIGTAELKFKDFPMQKSVYVVGNEQDYHFKVLQLIMKKLGRPYADGIYHLSYGMVDLPSGKMKSREGTVVDADDLMKEMETTASQRTEELGKIDGFTPEEAQKLYHQLAMGALKYYLLKVDPKRRMLFNPEESIDFQGNTGVYIQYNHAKICAIIRKAEKDGIAYKNSTLSDLSEISKTEEELVFLLSQYPAKVKEACDLYAPSIIASYAYELAKMYSKFYSELPIFSEEVESKMIFRVLLSATVASTIKKTMGLLGVDVPERM